MKYANCHSDRKLVAKGLCRSCYNLSTPKKREKAKLRTQVWKNKPSSHVIILAATRLRRAKPDWPAKRKVYSKKYQTTTMYGLSLADRKILLETQGGSCAIKGCEKPPEITDHDHRCCLREGSCGKCVRGLLCKKHNTGLGLFNDSPAMLWAAIEYLKHPPWPLKKEL